MYTLARKAHFSDKVIPSHVNSYFLSKALYWGIGGYDEDFWGTYGSDRLFRTRVLKSAPIKELPNSRLELVTRGSIPDAKNTIFFPPTVVVEAAPEFIAEVVQEIGHEEVSRDTHQSLFARLLVG